MEFQIYMTKAGSIRVNIGECSYCLRPSNPLTGKERNVGAQLASWEIDDVLEGKHGEVAQAWACAALKLAVPRRFNYARTGSAKCERVSPPWTPRPRDWHRDYAMSTSLGDPRLGVDMPLIHISAEGAYAMEGSFATGALQPR